MVTLCVILTSIPCVAGAGLFIGRNYEDAHARKTCEGDGERGRPFPLMRSPLARVLEISPYK